MSDEPVFNGGATDVDVEIAANEDNSDGAPNQTVQKLMQKLDILEQEKKQLVNDKDSAETKIKQLEDEIQSFESDKRALSSIAARAAELETEVSRLQHDLISSMSEGQESNAELAELKRVLEDLKDTESKKSEKADVIEKERNLLLERLNESEVKLIESDYQIRQLETKIEGLEVNNNNQKSEKLKTEDDVKSQMKEKDEEIQNLNRKVDEFQSVIVKNHAEIEKLKKEKDELQIGKNDLEAELKKSDMKVKELESKIDELESNEKINSEFKEKEVERMSNSKVDWAVIAATAGAVGLVAVVYFRHAKF